MCSCMYAWGDLGAPFHISATDVTYNEKETSYYKRQKHALWALTASQVQAWNSLWLAEKDLSVRHKPLQADTSENLPTLMCNSQLRSPRFNIHLEHEHCSIVVCVNVTRLLSTVWTVPCGKHTGSTRKWHEWSESVLVSCANPYCPQA